MRRMFVGFDERKIEKEFDRLPQDDRRALLRAMTRYEEGDEAGFRHSDYGDGLEMLTDGGRGQGRCLYFTAEPNGDDLDLVVLLVYKKETERAPQTHLDTARARKAAYLKEITDESKPDPS